MKYLLKSMQMARSTYYFELSKMDASYKIQRGIHVHLIQFFMCPEFWVHIIMGLRFFFA